MDGYSDENMSAGNDNDAGDKGNAPEKNEEQSGKESGLLSKSLFPHTPEPGDECIFKVVHVYDDEVEVEYAPKKKDGGDMDNDDTMERMRPYADKE